VGYDGHLTVEFVPSVDRTPISERRDIGDASEAGGGAGINQPWQADEAASGSHQDALVVSAFEDAASLGGEEIFEVCGQSHRISSRRRRSMRRP